MAANAHEPRTDQPAERQELTELLRDSRPKLAAVAFRRLGNWHDAEEAVSLVCLAAWRRQLTHPNTCTLPWLFGTLRNVVGTALRGQRRALALARRAESERQEAGHHDEATLAHIELRRAMSDLSAADQRILWLAYWGDLSGDEIGAILGCSHAAVRARLTRARRRLRAILG